jgi:hypothetical protein
MSSPLVADGCSGDVSLAVATDRMTHCNGAMHAAMIVAGATWCVDETMREAANGACVSLLKRRILC